MNKDEMVEEMAKTICEFETSCAVCEFKTKKYRCSYKSYCTKLYNAGYRKVTEDEIVESMKTYERARQETARDIISTIIDDDGADLDKIARKYGIELE